MAALSHSSPDPLSDSTPYTQDEEATDSLLQEVELPFRKSPPAPVSGRRFTAEAQDLSAPLLGQGFQYQTKQPNPPGQFVGRPIQSVVPAKQYPSNAVDSRTVQTRGAQNHSQQLPNEPLLLPELAFSPSTQDPDQTSPHFRAPDAKVLSSSHVVGDNPLHGGSIGHLSESNGALVSDLVASDKGQSSESRQHSPYIQDPSAPAQTIVRDSQIFRSPGSKASDSGSAVVSTPSSASSGAAVEECIPSAASHHPASSSKVLQESANRHIALNIAPHILRQGDSRRSSSPMSRCGDLEKPIRRPRSRRASKSPRCSMARPLSCDDSPPSYSLDDHVRSQSRASNVSKKRSAVHKQPRQGPRQRCPDRRAMMQEMASQWNQYLLAADRDKEEYRMEIEALQHDIDVQATQLEKATRTLQQRDQSLSKMQEKYAELQERQGTMSAARNEINEELEGLRKELDVTKCQTEAARERNSACRKKVNEAISEHQKLFKMTKSYCSDLQQQLASEIKKRSDQTDDVQKALQKSIIQRKAMKEFASFVEKEILTRETLKDETISALQSRIAEQNQTLSRVAFLERSLNTQLQAQQATRRSVDELHRALAAFSRVYDRDSDARALLGASVDAVDKNLHFISNCVQDGASNALTRDEAAAFFKSMQDNLSSSIGRIASALSAMEESAGNRVSSVEQTFQASLDTLKNEFTEQISQAKHFSTYSTSFEDGIHARFDQLDAELHHTQIAADLVERKLNSMISGGEANAQVASSKLDETLKRLEKRDNKINQLKTQLQLVTEDYHAKIEGMRKEAEVSESNSQRKARDTADQLEGMARAFEAQLDFALAQQREECELAMREEQTEHWTAENSLQKAKAKLQTLVLHNEEKQILEGKLKSQEDVVRKLKERIAVHEQQTKIYEELGHRWRQDIEAVDKIRSQLRSVDAQLPRVEVMGAGLDRIMRVHDFLSATAEYLTMEQDWVQSQLQYQKPRLSGSDKSCVSDPVNRSDRSEAVAWDNASRSLGTSQKEWERRRVVVQSPSGSVGSPSPPPSVEQERKRRRAGFETQSILRLSTTKSNIPQMQTSVDIDPEEPSRPERVLFHLMKGHSRYFRPITSTAPVVIPTANNGIVEQIRAGLTQNRGIPWSLPTLSDFEGPRNIQPAPQIENHVSESVEGLAAKRVKLES